MALTEKDHMVIRSEMANRGLARSMSRLRWFIVVETLEGSAPYKYKDVEAHHYKISKQLEQLEEL